MEIYHLSLDLNRNNFCKKKINTYEEIDILSNTFGSLSFGKTTICVLDTKYILEKLTDYKKQRKN